MKINIKGKEYRISWNHKAPHWDDYLFFNPGVSFCFIKDPNGNLISEGKAFCNVKDCFNKETGRKVSLTRALSYLGLNREERRGVWQEYAKFTRKTWPRFVKTNKRSV